MSIMQAGYKISLGIFYALVGTTGLIGNSAVIYSAMKNRTHKRNISYIYLIFLAITDLLGSIIIVPYFMISLHLPAFEESLQQKYNLPCRFGTFFVYAIGVNRILSLTVMSADRYIAIMHPFLYQKLVGARKIVFANCLVSFQSLGTNVPMLVVPSWTNYDGQPGAACGFVWKSKVGYLVPYVIFNFLVPLLVLIASNVAVFIVARKQRKRIIIECSNARVKRKSLIFGMDETDLEGPSTRLPFDNGHSPSLEEHGTVNDSRDNSGLKGPSILSCDNKGCLTEGGMSTEPGTQSIDLKSDNPNSIGKKLAEGINEVMTSTAEMSKRRPKFEHIRVHDIVIAFSTLVIVLVFVVTWFPFALSRVIFVLNRALFSWNTVVWTSSLTVISCACNPLIILGTRRDFRNTLKKKLFGRAMP